MADRSEDHDGSAPGVLIPVKAFSAAKERLSGVLDLEARGELARTMASRVVTAAGVTT